MTRPKLVTPRKQERWIVNPTIIGMQDSDTVVVISGKQQLEEAQEAHVAEDREVCAADDSISNQRTRTQPSRSVKSKSPKSVKSRRSSNSSKSKNHKRRNNL